MSEALGCVLRILDFVSRRAIEKGTQYVSFIGVPSISGGGTDGTVAKPNIKFGSGSEC
jgi:hypothetical protein